MILLNFTLLTITAGDKIKSLFGIQQNWVLILFVPLGFLGMWSFGFFMDKVVRAAQMSERQGFARSELWPRLFNQLESIENDLTQIKAKMSGELSQTTKDAVNR